MDSDCESQSSVVQSRSRVLVRSHAMREEPSPPREPTPTRQTSPRIQVIPSSTPKQQQQQLNLPSRNGSPADVSRTLMVSPTNTLTPSSPQCSPRSINSVTEVLNGSPKIHIQNGGPLGEEEEVHDVELDRKEEEIEHRKRNGPRKRTDSETSTLVGCRCVVAQNCNRCCLRVHEKNCGGNDRGTCSTNTLTISRTNYRGKLRHQNSSQGSFEGSLCNSPCLSRDSSSEQYTDSTGADLELFIPQTINKNAKDRALMLRIEQELVNLAKDSNKSIFKFPPMSSYQRMLVHRCAAYFGMDHNIEASGKCVVVNKTASTRIPDIQFSQHIRDDVVFTETEPRRSILKRDSSSEECSFRSSDGTLYHHHHHHGNGENRRSKSIEEREEEYKRARRRIFNRDMQDISTEDLCWAAEVPWSSSTESDISPRFRLQLPQQDHQLSRSGGGRLLKVHSEETARDDSMRPCVAKSYSFGGYGDVQGTRGDSAHHATGSRLLTKQDSAASSVSWRLSPSSSGYKTQSQQSESVTPSPTSTPHLRQDSVASVATNTSEQPSPSNSEQNDSQIVWVETDIHQAPRGSIIIDPQTAQPIKNQDGSLYHYDPSNPPKDFNTANKPPPSPQKTIAVKEQPSSPKRRSRMSPLKKSSLTNTATSPSLPFTPQSAPLPPRGTVSTISNLQDTLSTTSMQQQQYPVYGSQNYTPNGPVECSAMQIYPQQYVMYNPYTVPGPYDGRLQEPQIPEAPAYYMPEGATNPPVGSYQTPPPLWNQPSMPFYHQSQPSTNLAQRFTVPITGHPATYMSSSSYPATYVQHASNTSNPPSEMLPVFAQPPIPLQMIYQQSQPGQVNSVVYQSGPSQPVVYGQNSFYTNLVYPPQNGQMTYPQCAPTPGCQSVSSTFCPPLPHETTLGQPQPPGFGHHLLQNLNQMSISSSTIAVSTSTTPISHPSFCHQNGVRTSALPPPAQLLNSGFDTRVKPSTPKGNKFSNPKAFGMCSSSQGSAVECGSPAMTVIASATTAYCQNQAAYLHRTPPETPPSHVYGNCFNQAPPVLLRDIRGIRASPPIVNKNSRSPTPASDAPLMERHRFSLPHTLYPGMPYVFSPDMHLMAGRGQPNAYRQQPGRQQNVNQTSDSYKMHKNRKPRGNKSSNLPPNGKQSNNQ